MDVPTQQAYENLLGLQKKRSNLSRLSRFTKAFTSYITFLIKKNSPRCRILLGALLSNSSLHWFKGLSKLSVGLSSSMHQGVKHFPMSLVSGNKGLHGVRR